MLVQISEIIVHPRRRNVAPESVRELADSISELGLLNPITVDHNHILIAGLHRLEAVKLLHWTEIECTVSSLEGLMAEMAELDENFVRANLSEIEFGDLLMRRKEIYEALHPETRATYDGGGFRGNQHQKVVAAKNAATTKSFVEDTAQKLGLAPRTVRQEIQAAKNLTPEAKEIIRNADSKITKKEVLKLSQLEPEQQKEAARRLAASEIRSIDEYQASALEQQNQNQCPAVVGDSTPTYSIPSDTSTDEPRCSLQQIIADLKNHDKDGSYTPDSLLADVDGMVSRFHRDFEWYSEPHCTVVFPQMSREQLDFVKQRFASISAAMENLLRRMERNVKHEQPKKTPRK